ncbi:NRDE family protein [Desulfobacula sp.]|uniref:NRDE family protein n=1 Tax=Desulfobacula sp. TaxID=2593537 RepID=UPI0026195E91|nr:NRDE family protein [Desulfobacula sp.]
MCLILFGYKVSKPYPLILAANRDEFYQRPTAAMDFWHTPPDILAGKDLEQGGTWFGVHQNGTFAALTNYRDPDSIRPDAPSRGEIIVDFLASGTPPEPHFNEFTQKAGAYNGFNLLFGNKSTLFWYSNLKNQIQPISPGIHGLSNRFLDSPWPKVTSGKTALQALVRDTVTLEGLFEILADQSVPHDHQLPQTGVTREWERILSPIFIQSDTYGTRSSTVMLMDQGGSLTMVERTYSPENKGIFTDCHFFLPA